MWIFSRAEDCLRRGRVLFLLNVAVGGGVGFGTIPGQPIQKKKKRKEEGEEREERKRKEGGDTKSI